jgi:hypothetical protein
VTLKPRWAISQDLHRPENVFPLRGIAFAGDAARKRRFGRATASSSRGGPYRKICTEQGDDTHHALYRGTRSRLAVRQGAVERFRPELYVLPDEDISAALERRIAALQASYPGIGVEARGSGWRIAIPDALRIGHDAAFAAFARLFLAQVVDPESVPARERPNLLAKYRVTTGAVALSRR